MAHSYVDGSGNLGVLQTYGFQPGQVVEGIVDAKGVTTSYSKNYFGYVNTIVDAKGNVTQIQPNLLGQPMSISTTDSRGNPLSSVTNYYDPNTHDLLSSADSITGGTQSWTYDTATNNYGLVVTATNARNVTTNYSYNAIGELLSLSSPNRPTSSYTYNSFGETLTATIGTAPASTSQYDSYGRLSRFVDANGDTTTYNSYDGAGNLLQVTDADGNITQYQYDSFDRPLSITKAATTANAKRTLLSRWPAGQVHTLTDAFGSVTTSTYDSMGRLYSTLDPLGGLTTRLYDANGNLSDVLDPDGNHKHFDYDVSNELIKKTLPDDTVQFAYDAHGNMTSATNNSASIGMSYDGDSRLISFSTVMVPAVGAAPPLTITYNYDVDSNLSSVKESISGTTTSYAYDGAERLSSVTAGDGEVFGFGYDAQSTLNLVTRTAGGAAVDTSISRDNVSQILSVVHTGLASGTSYSFAYTRDGVGNPHQINVVGPSGSFTRSLTFDAENQLVSDSNPESQVASYVNENFQYDASHNLVSGPVGTLTYDSHARHVTSDGTFNYQYDQNGNMTTKTALANAQLVTKFHYNSDNRLVGIQFFNDGGTSSYKSMAFYYDAIGRRLQKNVADNTATNDPSKTHVINYLYEGQDVLFEYDNSGNKLARYTHSKLGTDDVLSMAVTPAGVPMIATSAGTYFFLKDGNGNITDIVNSTGSEAQHYVYSAFGKMLNSSNAINAAYSYGGHEFDWESGLLYMRARYLDPNLGRFISSDPVGANGKDLNFYRYAKNNPFVYSDPTGLWTLQLGLYGTMGGGSVLGISGGIAVGFDANLGITTSFWSTQSTGALTSYGGSAGVVVSVSANPTVYDLGGSSIETGGGSSVSSRFPLLTASGTVSVPLAPGYSNSYNFYGGIGRGPAGVSSEYDYTEVASNPMITPDTFDPANLPNSSIGFDPAQIPNASPYTPISVDVPPPGDFDPSNLPNSSPLDPGTGFIPDYSDGGEE